MRVQIGVDQPSLTRRCRAFLDGVDISNRCYLADEELGFAGVYRLNERGQMYADPENRKEAAKERLWGNVRIEISPEEGQA